MPSWGCAARSLIARLQVCDSGLVVTVAVLFWFAFGVGVLGRFIVFVLPRVGLLGVLFVGFCDVGLLGLRFVRFGAEASIDGLFAELGEVWDRNGRLLAQSSQLARLRPLRQSPGRDPERNDGAGPVGRTPSRPWSTCG